MLGFSLEAQRVMVEEAHRRGLVAETHSTSPEGLRLSLDAGVDLVQHPELMPAELPDDVVRRYRESGVICSMLSNTITGAAWQRHLKSSAEAKSKQDTAKVTRALTSVEQRARREARGEPLAVRRRNAEKLVAGGCTVTIGTDNYLGNAPEFRREPKPENQEMGIGSIIAIEGLVELGMTPMQALVAATRNGALAARGLDQFGTVEAGKLADLLLLDADPLADIRNIRKLSLVMKSGRVVDLAALPTHPVWHRRGEAATTPAAGSRRP
jgi:imidazolonepropionase-like amidohydrolase